jgi:hypothetical protein
VRSSVSAVTCIREITEYPDTQLVAEVLPELAR